MPAPPLRAADGWHFVCQIDGGRHRLWWPEPVLPAAGTALGFACALDPDLPERIDAALRFWHAVGGASRSRAPPPGPPPSTPRIRRQVTVLRALDGWLAGAAYRTIAEVLLGTGELPRRAWQTSTARGRTIRLVAAGRRLTEGGYRDLLQPSRRGVVSLA